MVLTNQSEAAEGKCDFVAANQGGLLRRNEIEKFLNLFDNFISIVKRAFFSIRFIALRYTNVFLKFKLLFFYNC